MKSLYLNILICFLFLSLASSSFAQKFGYINTAELIQLMPEVKEANANIETYKTQLQKKGQEMVESLQKKYVELERKQSAGEIAPKQLEVEAEALKQEQMNIAKFEQDSQQKILEKSETLLKPLRDRIQNAINDVAKENGYTYIFDYSSGVLLFADASTDVSNMVRSKLGLVGKP